MKNQKPIVSVAFIAIVFLLFSLFIFILPEGKLNIAGIDVRFMNKEKLLNGKIVKQKDISNIILNVDTVTVVEDTLVKFQNHKGNSGSPSGELNFKESSTTIHLNELGEQNLAKFFEKLENTFTNNKKMRILHYGDSQIEGDRMTNYIRQRIQEVFGGHGTGMIPAVNVYETMSYRQTYSSNFKRYTCFGGEKLNSKKYGYMNSAGRFTPEYSDTASINQLNNIQEGWIEISPNPGAFARSKNYNNVNLYYTSCIKPCLVNVYKEGVLIHQDSLKTDGKFHVLPLSFPTTPNKLKYEFKSTYSPTILGFGLEGDYGIQVENIAMRGSSGTFFGNIDQSLAAQMYNFNQVEMIIMQFGGNSVPSFRDSSSVKNYVNYFKGQLNTIKRLRPNAMILVIGPSDMSQYIDGEYQTYALLPLLVKKMKQATMDIGGGYWDLYSAMGGENSMITWVEKGLAAKDYIHFSNGGAKIMAQKFFEAFASEYKNWKK